MLYSHQSYRTYLRSVFSERIGKNPSYSLRAFAQQLMLAPSTLTEILKGKTNLSPAKSMEVAARLKLEPAEVEFFSTLVAFENAKNPQVKESHLKRLRDLNPTQEHSKHQDLSIDAFRVISDWYHLPILQILKIPSVLFTASVIAKRLGITATEVETAIDRLERLELIEKSSNGKYFRTKESLRIYSSLPNQGLRHFHKQMLEKAIDSLETQLPSEKVMESCTMAIDTARLQEAREAIDQMISKVEKLGSRLNQNTEVYHLTTVFFRITNPLNKNNLKKEKSK